MPDKPPCAPVLLSELRDGFDFATMGSDFGNEAYVNTKTGAVIVLSDEVEMDTRPDDLKKPGRYIALPGKVDLDLGRELVLAFAAETMPEEHDHISAMFRRRGAFGQFKDLLRLRGQLEAWHDYENRATDEALKRWCAENDIPLR